MTYGYSRDLGAQLSASLRFQATDSQRVLIAKEMIMTLTLPVLLYFEDDRASLK